MTEYVAEHALDERGQTLTTLLARIKMFDRLERLRAAGPWVSLYTDGRHDPVYGQVSHAAAARIAHRLHRRVQTRRGELVDAKALGLDIYGLREARARLFHTGASLRPASREEEILAYPTQVIESPSGWVGA